MENKDYDIVLALKRLHELKRVLSQGREYELKCLKLFMSWLYNVIPNIPKLEQSMLVELNDRLDALSRTIKDDEFIITPILEEIKNLLTGGETDSTEI